MALFHSQKRHHMINLNTLHTYITLAFKHYEGRSDRPDLGPYWLQFRLPKFYTAITPE